MLRRVSLGVLLALGAPAFSADTCQFLGPDYPAPVGLSSSAAFKKAIADFEANLSMLNGDPSQNAWSVSLSSTASNETLYERHFTPDSVKNATHGVKKIDGDSVYRVGSLSKVFTVYTVLVGLGGDGDFNDPITKYIPELKDPKKLPLPKDAVYDDINNVNWEEVTLGNLASQLSALAGDLSATVPPELLQAAGFPSLNGTGVPKCGASPEQGSCDRSELFEQLSQSHPIFPTSHSPAYSNIAYQLLAYAFEKKTGKTDFAKAMEDLIFKPLGMKSSSLTPPKSDTNAVIPGGNASLTWWNVDLGIDAPAGGAYSSMNDMLAFTRSILSSSLLSKAQTRRWLMPVTSTVDDNTFVGAPWEIRRFPLPNGHSTVLFSKDGDVGGYNAAFVLSPDHQIAITVLTSGPSANLVRDSLLAAMVNGMVPAVEGAAHIEANDHYSGTYQDTSTNSSVTIATDKDAGLQIKNLISRGVPSFDYLGQLLGMSGKLEPRLYPTTLKTLNNKAGANGTYTSRTSWRIVSVPPDANVTSENKYTDACRAWVTLNAPLFGGVGIDDVVFSLGEDGKATGIEMRGIRLQMQKQK